ncbi:MAG: hypothetical protein HYY76_05185 [Acidobacteria bacterium]|nr:hypothetical protein [Acidobacteriota bacterium]
MDSKAKWSLALTGLFSVGFLVAATLAYGQHPTVLAFSLGAVGGLLHELAQSRGRIFFIERHDDGVYLGSLAGMVLGGIAALTVSRGLLVREATDAALTLVQYQSLAYESLMAGIGLKGLTEASAGAPPTKEVTPLTALPPRPDRVPVP